MAPVLICSSPNSSRIAVPEADLFPITFLPVRLSNSSISSFGKPVSVKVTKGISVLIPIISQCPVIVSLPLLASLSRKNFAVGCSTGETPFSFLKFPIPIFCKFGIEKFSIFSAICPHVSDPLSPKCAASLPFPIPRESKTIKNTLLNFIIFLSHFLTLTKNDMHPDSSYIFLSFRIISLMASTATCIALSVS